ncbi:fasciclin domain-containing protein [Candidatus Woesebacteria bacterium]|nr:fasciclin domain-containing protein [Candidatus Woesebacteria bacterium]
MPVADTSEKMVAMEEVQKDSDAMQNIVEIASSNDDFSTLVTAVKQAGLVETLSSEGPFTVFAPTNEAFAKLPEATLQEVLADKDQLTAILTYHVVPGKVMAEDVINLTSATTVQGSDLTIDVEGSSVMVNNANVVSTDIEAENGVIYVIDAVLIPQ